jgi:hypothetical protein
LGVANEIFSMDIDIYIYIPNINVLLDISQGYSQDSVYHIGEFLNIDSGESTRET